MQKELKRYKSIIAVLVFVMLLFAVACSNTAPEGISQNPSDESTQSVDEKPLNIKFFRVAVEQDPQKDRMLLELQKRTNTKLEFITAPWDQVANKIMTILSSGEQVDIMAIDPGMVNYIELAKSGLILQLDDMLATDNYPIAKKLAYEDIYFNKYHIDEKVYGIPQPIQPGDWNN